jgi:opacity protein-like surface antigen
VPMYAKAPTLKAPVVQAAYNWTGFYIGGSAGVLNGWTDWEFPPFGATTNPRFAGALGGVQAGYDYQTGKWVFGVEGNVNATSAHGARPCPSPLDVFAACETNKNWIGTATGRVGYALWDRSLWYARGGVAFSNTRVTLNCNTGPGSIFVPLANCGTNDSQARAGWTIGYGTEFALARNWTVRGETNYYDLGTSRFTVAGPTPIDVREKGFISTVGINYRFSPGVVVAKY